MFTETGGIKVLAGDSVQWNRWPWKSVNWIAASAGSSVHGPNGLAPLDRKFGS
jgi:hypothetical protein